MAETLHILMGRLNRGQYLLSGWSVYLCTGVAGKKAPPKHEMQMIVEAAGGIWMEKIPNNITVPLLIITSNPEQKKQVSPKAVQHALRQGAEKRTTKWLFSATFTQTTDLPATNR